MCLFSTALDHLENEKTDESGKISVIDRNSCVETVKTILNQSVIFTVLNMFHWFMKTLYICICGATFTLIRENPANISAVRTCILLSLINFKNFRFECSH